MKDKIQVGKALGRVASGLFVVTAKCGDQEDAVLVSWVNQCSFDPPAVSIVLGTVRPARLLVEGSNAFIVNVLGKDDNTLLKHFSKPPKEDIFKGIKTSRGAHGIRVLKDAVSCLECEVVNSVFSGDHVLYIGEIVGGKVLKGGDPYVHTRTNGFNY